MARQPVKIANKIIESVMSVFPIGFDLPIEGARRPAKFLWISANPPHEQGLRRQARGRELP